jgi:DNA-directed RNA polymerase I subunit RPA43
MLVAFHRSARVHLVPTDHVPTVGKVNLCSPDHISLLVHRVFNASIPRHHIPTDHWEFEYGPADNDPEFAPDVVNLADAKDPVHGDHELDALNHNPETNEPPVGEDAEEKDPSSGSGRWVHKITSEEIGGTTGYLEFTIIGSDQILILLLSFIDVLAFHSIP